MGKGDKKTRRGKIITGSYGVRRKRHKRNSYKPAVSEPTVVKEVSKAMVAAEIPELMEVKVETKPAEPQLEKTELVVEAEVAEEKPEMKTTRKKAVAKTKTAAKDKEEKEKPAEKPKTTRKKAKADDADKKEETASGEAAEPEKDADDK
jgi:ribosomal small subunit protein bTHX